MECFGGLMDYDGENGENGTSEDILQLLGQQSNTPTERSSEGTEACAPEKNSTESVEIRSMDIGQQSSVEPNELSVEGESPQRGNPSTQSSSRNEINPQSVNNDQPSKDTDVSVSEKVEESRTAVTVPVIVKEEPLNDFNMIQAILGLNHSLAPADSSSLSFDDIEPRGRPRGPKHPVWAFFKLRKTQGPTNGYMCELCGGYFVGAANTTNAAKHLKCRHKAEYAQYIVMHESAKKGTFVGDLHGSLREIMLKGRAKRLANLGGIALPSMNIFNEEFEESFKEEPAREAESSSPQSYASPKELTSVLGELKKSVTPSTSANTKIDSILAPLCVGSPSQNTSTAEDSNPESNPKKPRLQLSSETSSDTNKALADQMQSFLRGFRRLENECQNLRFQLCAKDEQIAALRLQLLRERNKRENALLVIQQALLDNDVQD
ncbi:hypothetical protein Tcan_07315 [Toxocara canis]|uniref:Uncharacterized protein n=1 Tax=Toxocara canis TaxID=6265 RepID=A0A0B2V365_TOXCA|nr:hypothetical protein Tcan_07315 [Toxocara canis]